MEDMSKKQDGRQKKGEINREAGWQSVESDDGLPGFCRRVYAQVDLDAVAENLARMRQRLSPETKLLGIVKTDGYGHGAAAVAGRLERETYMAGFGVATFEEAHDLRNAGIRKPILVLGYTFPYCYDQLAEEEIRPAVFRLETIPQLAQAAARTGKPIKVHVKVDTGMNRIGITPDKEGISFLRELMRQKGIEIEGIFTHFARADEADKENALRQLRTFQDFLHMIEEELSLRIPYRHCANSAAILEMPEADMGLVRAGIAMYGLYPSEEMDRVKVKLKPVLSLHSHIVYIKTIHSGDAVSYGGTYTADKVRRVATIPVGYGDGYPRSLSGRGAVLIRGRRAQILGRICMDQLMVDVSDIPEAAEGDLVTLLGRDGEECIDAESLALLSGRFHYELVCDIGKRVPRVYVSEGKLTVQEHWG